MKEYKCIVISRRVQDTERDLNLLASQGWVVVCSYAWNNYYIILERETKNGKNKI